MAQILPLRGAFFRASSLRSGTLNQQDFERASFDLKTAEILLSNYQFKKSLWTGRINI
ncbi:hypothetical protein [Rahnella sp. PCH160]|uniref:hypothetical protein n=1 Tax=Rahnella sp. PCH160 TaxID=3447928 RepID=UPI0039FD838B